MNKLKLVLILLTFTFFTIIITLFVRANTTPKHMTLNAPHGQVTIDRDEHLIPHINALNDDRDAFYALGYVHAEDRLWQLEFQRRVAAGRLSEIFGDQTIKQDEYLRTWGFYRAATKAWDAMDENTKEIVRAYTQGVNAYVNNHTLPMQFYLLRTKPEPWTNIDSIAWQKMMAWTLDSSWQRKIKNYWVAKETSDNKIDFYFPPYPETAQTILSDRNLSSVNLFASKKQTPNSHNNLGNAITSALKNHAQITTKIRNQLGFNDSEGKGSNAWVVSGKMTTTGKPILADDVHLALSSPSLFYLVDMRGPTLHVTGASIAGLPIIAIGHNDHIAWGVTHSYTDTQDLYIENNDTKVITRKEIIYVKGQKPIEYLVQESNHGPIISTVTEAGKINQHVAIKWVALEPNDTTAISFAKINYATNWQEFVNALQYYVSPPQNFVYADTAGNIGYYLSGKIPLRSNWVGTFPITAAQQHEWQGYIPFSQLPHTYNPPEGFIATANNKIATDHYPYSLTFRWNVPPYRVNRIVDVLQRGKVSVQNTIALQMDTSSYLWLDMKSILLSTKPRDTNSRLALAILRDWDGRFDLNSQAASIFAYWYQALLQSTSQANESLNTLDPAFLVKELNNGICYASYTKITDCQQHLSNTLAAAMTMLIREHGKQWQWSQVHHAVFEEAVIGKSKVVGWIWNRTASTAGGDYTVNVGTYEPDTMNQKMGPAYRQIIDLSNMDNSLFVIPLGERDDPLNLHYNDLLSSWVTGRYVQITDNLL